ncbi:uncharacterized protein PG986_012190 [Apiospora aurea]|uniref:Uncharacterized protein n=1 Tax=Apiospora aurea TaxID=335848 RepID=A0ABR1PZA4_9PEZI
MSSTASGTDQMMAVATASTLDIVQTAALVIFTIVTAIESDHFDVEAMLRIEQHPRLGTRSICACRRPRRLHHQLRPLHDTLRHGAAPHVPRLRPPCRIYWPAAVELLSGLRVGDRQMFVDHYDITANGLMQQPPPIYNPETDDGDSSEASYDSYWPR